MLTTQFDALFRRALAMKKAAKTGQGDMFA